MEKLILHLRNRIKRDYNFDLIWLRANIGQSENDGVVEIVYRHLSEEFSEKFEVTFKRNIRKHNIIQFIQSFPNLISKRLIIGETIDDASKKIIVEHGGNYIDGAANMHILAEHYVIHVEGNKYEIGERPRGIRLFNTSTFKVIFALLVIDDLINEPYRDIAEYSGSSLGTVNNVINQLKVNNYVISVDEKTLRLTDTKKLLERWIDSYEEKFKRDLFIDKFKFRDGDWMNIEFQDKKTLWGGESAAAIITNHLIPDIFTLYTEESVNDLIINYPLIPNPAGNINVYRKFWNFDKKEYKKTVPPLLVYADLMESVGPRNIETAKIIYEQHLQNKLS